MANVFALLGLRALFVLVEGLIRRFRYLDETIAIVLGIVAVKLLIEDLFKIGPVLSLVIVFVAFAIGIVASVIADRRDPDAEAKRDERTESLASEQALAAELAQLTLDLASTSSGGWPRARGARCGHHELADLLAQARVDGRRGQARRAPPRRRAAPRRGARRSLRASSIWRISSSRSPMATGAGARPRRGSSRGRRRGRRARSGRRACRAKNSVTTAITAAIRDDREDDDPERLLHRHHGPMWRRVRRRTMAPRRPAAVPAGSTRWRCVTAIAAASRPSALVIWASISAEPLRGIMAC